MKSPVLRLLHLKTRFMSLDPNGGGTGSDVVGKIPPQVQMKRAMLATTAVSADEERLGSGAKAEE